MVTIFIILIIIRLAKGEEKKGEVLARLDQLTKERKQLLVSSCGNLKKEEEKSKKYDNLKKSFFAIASFLQEAKAGLDLEIGMYHCLVATEEERLGLQPGDGGNDDGDDGGGNDDDDDYDGGGNDDDAGVSSPLKKKASASTRPFAILMSILELVGLAIYIWRKR